MGMTPTETTFLVFPAFLIGAALAILVALALTGSERMKRRHRSIALSIAGSAAGVLIYLATPDWWPFIAGPFMLTTAIGIGGALIGSLRRSV
jgi:peptidoglycan/LPS O-acetylase OafA/YrhL